jgi:hypothetical protein
MKGIAQTIPGLSNQVLVQIEIARGKLHCYPQRASDTLIYKRKQARVPVHGRPLEVRWVVTGLQDGQVVRILPKDRGPETFARQSSFQIGPDSNTLTSGQPRHGAGRGHCFTWRYGIVLLAGERGKVLDRLDPGIIIKDYP